jgi:hypothetical protein
LRQPGARRIHTFDYSDRSRRAVGT